MGSTTGIDERYGFTAVEAVLSDPFPPGLDPATVRLPTVPRVRSADDDEAHHRAYWRASVWAVLRRYQVAYADPACSGALRDGYPAVAADALRLADRASGPHPMSPLDSVACHAALKDLTAGVASLESTVAALRTRPVASPVPALAPFAGAGARGVALAVAVAPGAGVAGAAGASELTAVPEDVVVAGVPGSDFFPGTTPSRPSEFKLSLRGTRGLLRRRATGASTTGSAPTG